jgi:hypothetical protein
MSISSFARLLGPMFRSTVAACGIVGLTTVHAVAQQSFVTLKGDPRKEGWWLIAEFNPITTQVRGIPANQIRKSWCKATEFRKDLLPKELLFEGGVDTMQSAGLSFAVEGSFDGTAEKQIVLVGVFQECAGQKGRFILILDKPAEGQPKVRFLDAVHIDRQFGALQKGKGGNVFVWECMECDGSSVLRWDRKKARFDWAPQANKL